MSQTRPMGGHLLVTKQAVKAQTGSKPYLCSAFPRRDQSFSACRWARSSRLILLWYMCFFTLNEMKHKLEVYGKSCSHKWWIGRIFNRRCQIIWIEEMCEFMTKWRVAAKCLGGIVLADEGILQNRNAHLHADTHGPAISMPDMLISPTPLGEFINHNVRPGVAG